MKKLKKLFLTLAVLSIIVSVIRIIASAALSTTGIDLANIQGKTQEIKDQNLSLKETLYKTSSLTYIYDKAKGEGFDDAGKSITLSSPIPVAYKQ